MNHFLATCIVSSLLSFCRLLLIGLCLLFAQPSFGQTDEGEVPDAVEYAALKAVYDAFKGDQWKDNSNWLQGNTSTDFATWYGVRVENGDVSGINLVNNRINGYIPEDIGDLTNLSTLIIKEYSEEDGQLYGSIPERIGDLSRLSTLHIIGNSNKIGISGTLPESLWKLTYLNSLFINRTAIEGTISNKISNLIFLENLGLDGNRLEGDIPDLSSLGLLRLASFSENRFEGLSPSFKIPSLLSGLYLSDNNLTGNFIDDLVNLYELGISGNKYTFSEIEPLFSGINQPRIHSIVYGTQKRTEAKVPEIVNVRQGEALNIPYTTTAVHNQYRWQKEVNGSWQDVGSGQVYTKVNAVVEDAGSYRCVVTNDWATELELISTVVLVNVEGAPLDPQTQALVDYVDLISNPGALPDSWSTTHPIDISTWEGVEMNDGLVTEIVLQEQNVGGSLPESFANLTGLRKLNLAGTGLTGQLPSALSQLTELRTINLSSNSLDGGLPDLSSLTQLKVLSLHHNQALNGPLPDLRNAASLKTLNLGHNQFSGPLPDYLHELDELQTIKLANNQLTGELPEDLFDGRSLEVLHLQNNELIGDIPPPPGIKFKGLVLVLPKLHDLNLAKNKFTYLPDFTNYLFVFLMSLDVKGNQIPLADIAYNHTGEGAHPFATFSYEPQQPGAATIAVTGQVFVEGRDVALRVEGKEHPQHTYQWQKKEKGNWVDIPDANERSLLISDVAKEDIKAKYQVLLGNAWATLANARSEQLDPEAQDFHRYVRVYTPREEITSANAVDLTTAVGEVAVSTDYIDGLGRTVQSVSRGAGGAATQDVVQFNDYDALGRVETSYLPYAADGATGDYRAEASKEQKAFYKDVTNQVVVDNFPYSATRYDTSPLSRVLEQGAPGKHWQLGEHTVSMGYDANTAADAVSLFVVSGTDLNRSGTYPAGELAVAKTTDENGHYVRQFTDKQGQAVLKRVQGPAGTLDTYSVYDERGRLRFTIPPQAVTELGSTWSQLNDATFREQWLFVYEYDALGRMSAEAVPGGGTTRMIYDRWGRLVYSQSALMRALNPKQWVYTKYDYLDRPVLSGVFATTTSDEATLRAVLRITKDRFEERNSSAVGYTLNNSYPKNITEGSLRTVSYYDDYDFPSAIASSLDYEDDDLINVTQRADMKGELTGSLTRNLANDSWLGSVIYYDTYYRPIVAVTENHLGGIDRTVTKYASSVLDEVEETFTTHTTTAGSHTVRQTYDYDHQGRLLKVTHKLNSQPTVTLASYAYNELGQMVEQELNPTTLADQVSQTVDYAYHVRGWLTAINDVDSDTDYFAQRLVYNRGGQQRGSAVQRQRNGSVLAQRRAREAIVPVQVRRSRPLD